MDTPPPLPALLARADAMRRLARHLLRDAALADDVMQEAWLAVLRRPAAAPRDPRGWFAGVVRNLARRAIRGERRAVKRARRAARPEGTPPTDDVVGRLELQEALLRAVRDLEEPYRRAITRRYLDGQPPRVIAAEDGVPVATVRSHLRRGLERLRGALDARPGGRRAWAAALVPWATRSAADVPNVGWTVAGVGLATAAAATLALSIGGAWLGRDAPTPVRGEVGDARAVTDPSGPIPAAPALAAAPSRPAGDDRGGSAPADGVAWIDGVVADAAGRGRDGVLVLAMRQPVSDGGVDSSGRTSGLSTPDAVVVARATTGSGGRFRLQGLGLHEGYMVTAVPAAPDVGSSVGVRVGERLGRVVRLHVVPGRTLRGRVVDAAGRGVVARVRIAAPGPWRIEDPSVASVGMSADDGTFALAAPDGPLHVHLSTSARSVWVETPRAWDAERRFLLEASDAASAEGTVHDVSGAAVGAAEVVLELRADPDAPLASWTVRTISDAGGRWRIDGLPAARVTRATARARGFVPVPGQLLGVRLAAARATPIELRVRPERTLRGRVVAAGGVPVAGATVAIDGYADDDAWSAVVRTDAEGRFRVDGQPPGHAGLMAWSETYVPRPRPRGTSAPPGAPGDGFAPTYVSTQHGDAEVEVPVVAGRFVAGTVVDAGGGPVADALVVAGSERDVPEVMGTAARFRLPTAARSSADGTFRVGPLPPTADVAVYATVGVRQSERVVGVDLRERDAAGLALRLTDGRVVSGRARDADGAPVRGVVEVVASDGRWVAGGLLDAEGRFEVRAFDAETVEFRVVGRRPASGTTWPRRDLGPDGAHDGIEIVVEPRRTIGGRVTDAGGALRPRVRIEYRPVDGTDVGRGPYTAASGDDGTFEVEVPPGTYRFEVSGAGEARVVAAGARDVHLVVGDRRPPARIVGVLLAPDGRPVGGATLRIWQASFGGWIGSDVVVEGPSIDLEAPSAPGDSVWVTSVRTLDGALLPTQPLRLMAEDRGTGPATFRVAAGLVIEGRVVDPRGAAVRALVSAWEVGAPGETVATPGRMPASVQVGADGTFRIDGLAVGDHALSVDAGAPWLPPSEPIVVASGRRDVVVTLARGARVAGHVVGPDDEPVEGWIVATEGPAPYRRVRTDARGAFDLECVSAPAGTVRVSAHPDPAQPKDPRGYLRSAIVAAPAGATDVKVRLARGVFVEGTVVDAAGLAVPEGGVQARLTWPDSTDRRGFETAPVDRDGRFRLGPVAPGPVVLFYQPAMARPRWAGSGEVSVVAPRADVVVVVHPTVALHGRVVGGSVQGIALWNPAEGNPGPRAPLDADGRFALRGLPPRPGLLYITDGVGDRYVLVDRVSPGEAPLELAWSDGAAIEGRVVGLPAQTSVGIEAVAGAFTAGASTSVDGTFRIRALPPGRYRLRLAGSYRGGSEDVAAGTSGVLVTAVSR